jgi:NAD(P)-dependent dehydrogenase (short-subunit alcohol dehydrogenase family)
VARERFGGFDVVVANAAVSVYEEFEHQSEETIDVVLDTDLVDGRPAGGRPASRSNPSPRCQWLATP